MAGIYERWGDVDKAIEEYEAALQRDPSSALIHIRLASNFIKKDDSAKAIEELKIASSLEPDAVEPHAILALLYSVEKKNDLAASEYEIALKNAVKLEPKNAEIYKNLGLIYLRQKKFKEAQNSYRMALEISPNDAEAHFYMANVYDALNDAKLVESELKKAIHSRPDYPEALNYLGYMYAEEDRNLSEAEAMIKKALEIDSDNGAYIDSLGWVYFRKGKFQEAIVQLERAITLLEDPIVYDHLGDAYLKAGDTEKARYNWQRACDLRPDRPDFQGKIKEKLNQLQKTNK